MGLKDDFKFTFNFSLVLTMFLVFLVLLPMASAGVLNIISKSQLEQGIEKNLAIGDRVRFGLDNITYTFTLVNISGSSISMIKLEEFNGVLGQDTFDFNQVKTFSLDGNSVEFSISTKSANAAGGIFILKINLQESGFGKYKQYLSDLMEFLSNYKTITIPALIIWAVFLFLLIFLVLRRNRAIEISGETIDKLMKEQEPVKNETMEIGKRIKPEDYDALREKSEEEFARKISEAKKLEEERLGVEAERKKLESERKEIETLKRIEERREAEEERIKTETERRKIEAERRLEAEKMKLAEMRGVQTKAQSLAQNISQKSFHETSSREVGSIMEIEKPREKPEEQKIGIFKPKETIKIERKIIPKKEIKMVKKVEKKIPAKKEIINKKEERKVEIRKEIKIEKPKEQKPLNKEDVLEQIKRDLARAQKFESIGAGKEEKVKKEEKKEEKPNDKKQKLGKSSGVREIGNQLWG